MGSKASADCAWRDSIWHLARVLVKMVFYLLVTCLLWGPYLEGRLRQVGGSNSAERAGAATAGTAAAPYPVYHRADPVPWAKRGA